MSEWRLFIKNHDEDGRSHNLTNFIGAVCDKDRAKILWPEEKDLGTVPSEQTRLKLED